MVKIVQSLMGQWQDAFPLDKTIDKINNAVMKKAKKLELHTVDHVIIFDWVITFRTARFGIVHKNGVRSEYGAVIEKLKKEV